MAQLLPTWNPDNYWTANFPKPILSEKARAETCSSHTQTLNELFLKHKFNMFLDI